MAGKSTTLAIKIVGDSSSGVRALDETESRTGRFLRGMGTAAVVGAGAVIGVVGAIGVAAFNAASDLEQSTGAINTVFKDHAEVIKAAAGEAGNAVGLSANAYQELASVIGAQLSGTGMSMDEVTDKTQQLVTKGADLAATFGGSTADAVAALSSVLKGETDPIERYGVSIKQSDIAARLAAEGSDKLTGSALKQATANAALAIVTEQTAAAQGAFGRESDTAAGASARLSAWFENTKASLGEKLLPMFVTAADFFSTTVAPAIENITAKGGPLQTFLAQVADVIKKDVVPMAKQMGEYFRTSIAPIIGDIAGVIQRNFVPAFRGIVDILSKYVIPIIKNTLTPIMAGVRSAFNDVAGAVEDNRDKFENIYKNVQPLLAFLRDKVAPFIGGTLKTAFSTAGEVIGFLVDKIAWILDKGSAVVGIIGKVFGAGTPAAELAGEGAAPLFGAARTRTASPLRGAGFTKIARAGGTAPAAGMGVVDQSTTININVAGATLLDAEALADYLRTILDRRDVRTGMRVAVRAAAR